MGTKRAKRETFNDSPRPGNAQNQLLSSLGARFVDDGPPQKLTPNHGSKPRGHTQSERLSS